MRRSNLYLDRIDFYKLRSFHCARKDDENDFLGDLHMLD